MYKKIDDGISEIDKDYILFFQSIPFPDILPFFGGIILKSFDHTPVDNSVRKQALNVHNYCCASGPNICRKGEPSLSDAEKCSKFHKKKVKTNKEQAHEIGIPSIITEFGACSDSEACYYEI